MANLNGLMLPQAFSAPNTPYYVDASAPELVEPTLVSEITLQASAVDGTLAEPAKLYVNGTTAIDAAYVGAVSILPGGNTLAEPSAGITIRSAAGSAPPVPGTIVEIGANSEGPNILYIAGASGVGQVYDEKYNQPVNPIAVASSTGSLPITTIPRGFAFSYTPDKTGAYMLQVNMNIRNADAIPLDGFIEWVMTDGAEVQYASMTVNSNQLIKVVGMDEINGTPGGIPEPTDFTFSNLCFLTAGVAVSLSINTARNSTVGGLSWSIQNYDARLIQMC